MCFVYQPLYSICLSVYAYLPVWPFLVCSCFHPVCLSVTSWTCVWVHAYVCACMHVCVCVCVCVCVHVCVCVCVCDKTWVHTCMKCIRMHVQMHELCACKLRVLWMKCNFHSRIALYLSGLYACLATNYVMPRTHLHFLSLLYGNRRHRLWYKSGPFCQRCSLFCSPCPLFCPEQQYDPDKQRSTKHKVRCILPALFIILLTLSTILSSATIRTWQTKKYKTHSQAHFASIAQYSAHLVHALVQCNNTTPTNKQVQNTK